MNPAGKLSARGVRLFVEWEAIGEADDKGVRAVLVRVNGQLRLVFAKDRSVAVTADLTVQADRTDQAQVPAPFSGTVTMKLAVGE